MRPNPTISFRVPPFTTKELKAVLKALKDEGVDLRQDDLVATLISRATAFIGDEVALDDLGDDVRAYKKKARRLGF
jgi:hypothetical protein